jgi:hypothetical protein
MLIRSEYGLFNPFLWVNISLQFLHCYTLTGQHIWTFKDENVIREPIGIALDKNRNVYVAGKGINNVVVLSSN